VGIARDTYTAKLQWSVKAGEVNEAEARAFMQLSAAKQEAVRNEGGKLAKWRSDIGDEEYEELSNLLVKEFEVRAKYTKKSVDLERKSSGYAKAAAKARASDAAAEAAAEARAASDASAALVEVVQARAAQVVEVHREQVLDIAQIDADADAQRLEAMALNAENEYELLAQSERGRLELKQQALDEEHLAALTAAERIGADTKAINQKYKTAQLELSVQTVNSELQMANNLVGAVGALFGENVEAQKATKAAQIGISSIQGAAEAVAQSMSLGPIAGPIMGGILAAGQIASGVSSIKKVYAVKNPLPKGGKSLPRVSTPSGGGTQAATRISDGGLLQRQSTTEATKTAAAQTAAEGGGAVPVLVVDDVTAAQKGLKSVEVVAEM